MEQTSISIKLKSSIVIPLKERKFKMIATSQVVDSQGEILNIEEFRSRIPSMKKREAAVNLGHLGVNVGRKKDIYIETFGELIKQHSNQKELVKVLSQYPEKTLAIVAVGQIHDGNAYDKMAWKMLESGEINGGSIGFHPEPTGKTLCDGIRCGKEVRIKGDIFELALTGKGLKFPIPSEEPANKTSLLLGLKTKDGLEIRSATKSDAEAILNIAKKSLPENYTKPYFDDLLKSNGNTNVVASLNDKIIGYTMVKALFPNSHIPSIAVLPEYRGKGIAQKMLETVAITLKSQNKRAASLIVRKSNIPAINLYSKLNFDEISVLKSQYSDGEDGLLMLLSLKAKDFKEEQHPRDGGKFSKKPGSGKKPKDKQKKRAGEPLTPGEQKDLGKKPTKKKKLSQKEVKEKIRKGEKPWKETSRYKEKIAEAQKEKDYDASSKPWKDREISIRIAKENQQRMKDIQNEIDLTEAESAVLHKKELAEDDEARRKEIFGKQQKKATKVKELKKRKLILQKETQDMLKQAGSDLRKFLASKMGLPDVQADKIAKIFEESKAKEHRLESKQAKEVAKKKPTKSKKKNNIEKEIKDMTPDQIERSVNKMFKSYMERSGMTEQDLEIEMKALFEKYKVDPNQLTANPKKEGGLKSYDSNTDGEGGVQSRSQDGYPPEQGEYGIAQVMKILASLMQRMDNIENMGMGQAQVAPVQPQVAEQPLGQVPPQEQPQVPMEEEGEMVEGEEGMEEEGMEEEGDAEGYEEESETEEGDGEEEMEPEEEGEMDESEEGEETEEEEMEPEDIEDEEENKAYAAPKQYDELAPKSIDDKLDELSSKMDEIGKKKKKKKKEVSMKTNNEAVEPETIEEEDTSIVEEELKCKCGEGKPEPALKSEKETDEKTEVEPSLKAGKTMTLAQVEELLAKQKAEIFEQIGAKSVKTPITAVDGQAEKGGTKEGGKTLNEIAQHFGKQGGTPTLGQIQGYLGE